MEFAHTPVLLKECVEGLRVKPGGIYVDGTLGGAGHASAIADRLGEGILIGVDRDAEAVEKAGRVLEKFRGGKPCIRIYKDNYSNIDEILLQAGIKGVDGILLDLGMSSHQVDETERGFSYAAPARLDMRMDAESPLTAFDVVNGYEAERLAEIMFGYGEERYSRPIAAAIVRRRADKPVETTAELAEIVMAALPKKALDGGGGRQSVKRVFQAVRIEVNDELAHLEAFFRKAAGLLNPGGRVCVITFHSLEDRITKNAFREWADPCMCPRDFPVCVCGKKPVARIVTRKPILPSEEEAKANPRARSAKLRIAEKI
ncbi:MAG: 16S rRNA (cytosine(1402)-N(4))-methyltransferase RsmH [Firmicutes bacterium]|nr:16S rRNA (cytosine(1402)-N(4))-methyltransferase RsmH [Bacillota bacterium]